MTIGPSLDMFGSKNSQSPERGYDLAINKLQSFLDEYHSISIQSGNLSTKVEDLARKEMQILIVFQIMVMKHLDVSVEEYSKINSGRFREEFAEDGDLTDARDKLLAGQIDVSLELVCKYLHTHH